MAQDGPQSSDDAEPKDAAAVRIFPPGVPLATILIGVVFQRVSTLDSSLMPQGSLRYWIGGTIICASVFFLGFRAVSLMRKSGQSENPYKKTTEIIEAGPYRFTRNPMYLQMVLACLGVAVLLANPWIAILTPVCGLVLHFWVIRPEESYLERKFGDQYLEYKNRVRRWL